MSIKKKHFVNVSDSGVVEFEDIANFKQDALNNRGKRCYVTIKKVVKHRSNPQNRYFHGVIAPMMGEAMGCSMEEAKDALKFEFLRYQLECEKWTVKQTSKLSTVEFEDFCSKCRVLASQMFGLYVPNCDEVEF